ncbi:hypothetical protein Plhal304r1_c008g0031191 [Plasmopara halstedii]
MRDKVSGNDLPTLSWNWNRNHFPLTWSCWRLVSHACFATLRVCTNVFIHGRPIVPLLRSQLCPTHTWMSHDC